MSNQKEISLVGYGINFHEQRSVQVDEILIDSDIIFAVEPDIEHLEKYFPVKKSIVNLFDLYVSGKNRVDVYKSITDRIFASLDENFKVVLLVDGCPFFLDSICDFIEERALESNINLKIINGISSLDTIIQKLRLPIYNYPISVHVANDFCNNLPVIDDSSILVLFQPGNVNCDFISYNNVSESGINLLKEVLLKYFDLDDKWLLINLSNSPDNPTQVIWNTIENIHLFINYLHSGTLILSKKWWPKELCNIEPTIIEGTLTYEN